ncbi:M6 metalloprotease [Trichoderma barbatum]
MGYRCHEGLCAVSIYPDLFARHRVAAANTSHTSNQKVLSALPMRHGTGIFPGLNDGTIFPKSHFDKSVSASTMSRAALDREPLRAIINVVLALVGAKERFQNLFFSTGQVATGSVKEFYQEVSGGKISLDGEVIGPLPLRREKAYYANGKSGMDESGPNSMTMADEAVTAATGRLNMNKYDNDKNGYSGNVLTFVLVDVFCVVHAGSGAEESGSADDIWSLKWTLPAERKVNDVNIYGFLTIPEDARIGGCAHEIGRLPGIGNWCLMASGNWGGCKANQGWITVVNETQNHRITLADVKSDHKTHRLWKDGDMSSQEYFLIKNRQSTGFDSSLPSDGLLVWHVDDAVDNNKNERRSKVGLLQADGLAQLEIKGNHGDAGDPFPGITNKIIFNSTTAPSSKSYAGRDSFVSITNIPVSSHLMTFDITAANTFAGHALDVINDGASSKDNMIQMRRESNISGQHWQIVANVTGTFTLRTLFLGANQQLNAAGSFTGQIWRIEPWGDGTWHLENLFSSKDLYLDTMEGGPKVAMNWANVGRPTQRWTIASIRDITESGF